MLKQRGFLSRVVPDADVATQALASARRIAALAPQAARLNKQPCGFVRNLAVLAGRTDLAAYRYADSRRTPRRHHRLP
jgi:enoyl-CoA hydratase